MNDTRDERLRWMLREADPAEAESGLTIEETRAMRRTVLTAIPEPRRRFAHSPALAGAALAVLAAIAVLMLWPRPESTAPPPPAGPNIAVKQTHADVKRTDVKRTDVHPDVNARVSDAGPAETRRAGAVAAGLRARRWTPSAPREQIAAAAPAPANEPETSLREIQFDTPGGTRVIWILRSDNAL